MRNNSRIAGPKGGAFHGGAVDPVGRTAMRFAQEPENDERKKNAGNGRDGKRMAPADHFVEISADHEAERRADRKAHAENCQGCRAP
ncbi:hypothetical protein GCM10011494_20200 [Novosphingobium endophyticum]|uniref:Uncharacterized protein n=1 Tax=Novosphingobium endophyticum TaxID=1955250 RepID=A0A916X4N1_9SPHN|nr:hypothetical protein [Novosphingobium endophyticum]GGC01634.1 hypothetical protein GCM10011494_20200 [Novosphingobium endophyticum]